jgi:hypothetical protein
VSRKILGAVAPTRRNTTTPSHEERENLNLIDWNLLLGLGSESGLAATEAWGGLVDGLANK